MYLILYLFRDERYFKKYIFFEIGFNLINMREILLIELIFNCI